MTTVETQTHTLIAACDLAGDGGTITGPSSSHVYNVGVDEETGTWTLAFDGSEPASLTGYVTEGWTVASHANRDTTQTFQQFFDSLQLYSFIQNSDGQYVFLGWVESEAGSSNTRARAKLISTDYMRIRYQADMEHPCTTWTRVLDDDGHPVIADWTLRVALRTLTTRIQEIEVLGARVRELETSFQSTVSDFRRLNDQINEYADESGMCSDYETRLWRWNEDFATMKLQGRMQSYQVPVSISALSDATIWVYPVEARSPEEAKEEVGSWSTEDVLKAILDNGAYLENIDVDLEVDGEQAQIC